VSLSTFPRLALFAFKVFCTTVIVFVTVFTVYTVGPALERRYFPVVSKLTILDMKANEDGNAVIMAEFTKTRACEWVGLAWFKGKPEGGFERVSVILHRQREDTSSPNRPLGTQKAGPWIIGIPAEEIAGNSFAKLRYRCHGLWTTEADFWP